MNQHTPFVHFRRVEVVDTDMAGIVHFSNLVRYMEEAEHAFLRSRGMSVFQQFGDQLITWPRRTVHCDFKSPARFEQTVAIAVHIERIGNKSLTWKFDLSIEDRRIATGGLVTVCCVMQDDGRLHSISIPPEIVAKLSG